MHLQVVPSWDMGTKVGETSFKSSLHTDLSKISESDGENRESLSDRVQLDNGAAPGSVGSVPDTVEYESSNPTTLEIEPHPVNKDTMSMERHQSLLALRKQRYGITSLKTASWKYTHKLCQINTPLLFPPFSA